MLQSTIDVADALIKAVLSVALSREAALEKLISTQERQGVAPIHQAEAAQRARA